MHRLLIALLFVFATSAFAETVEMKVSDLDELIVAIRDLDGANSVGPDGKPVRVTYNLAPAVRWKLTANLAELKRQQAVFTEARDAAVQRLTGKTRVPMDPSGKNPLPEYAEVYDKVLVEVAALLAVKIKVELQMLTQADLAIDQNAIPIQVLAGLSPILKP